MILAGMEFTIGVVLAILLCGTTVRVWGWAQTHQRDAMWLTVPFLAILGLAIVMLGAAR